MPTCTVAYCRTGHRKYRKNCGYSIATITSGTLQKSNRCSTLNGEKNIFVPGYSTTDVYGIWKKSVGTLPSSRKKSFLTTVLLGCMGLGRNSIRLDPHRKKNLATVLLWYIGLRKNSIGTQSPPKKKIIFLFLATLLLWCIGPRKKNQSLTTITEKIYFLFWLQYSMVQRT